MSNQNKTIREKNEELTRLIDWFNGGDLDLEKAFDKFKEAEKLAAEIEDDLTLMKNEIQIIKKKFNDIN
jgi:exodeoxyribonuclease VII small subunit